MSDPTITDVIGLADMDDVLEVVGRLEFLPEFGMNDRLKKISALAIEAKDIEEQARAARGKAREHAQRLVDECRKKWKPSQIKQATGYYPGKENP